MKTRAEIILNGAVQQAGYRDYVGEQAFDLDLVGNARNLDDGTVKVICEGDRKTIEEFAQKIKIKQYPINVRSVEVSYSKPTGEFQTFEIIWEDDLAKASFERMATAAMYLRQTNTKIDETNTKIDKTNTMLEETNTKIDGMNVSIKQGFARTDGDFDRMDVKYGEISGTLKEINKNLVNLTNAILALVNKSK